MTGDEQDFARYAVYAAPAPTEPLGAFGAAWLGWDAEAGRAVPRFAVDGLPEPVESLTVEARRYGFHGTLKAPFRLAAGRRPSELRDALRATAAGVRPVAVRLVLAERHGFVALRPADPAPELAAAAQTCVERLDAFRAPSTEAELARRRAAGLTASQEENLRRWGYPYVGRDFHFHFTLTRRLDPAAAAGVVAALAPSLEPILAAPFALDALCLFGDPGDGAPFTLVDRVPLGG